MTAAEDEETRLFRIQKIDTEMQMIKELDLGSRISCISQIGDSYKTQTYYLDVLVEWLTRFWEESTCSGVLQCTLNKTILHVAAKYLESDITNSLSQFFILGTKANTWCRKHLQMTIMLTEHSQDEKHCDLFLQLILDSLSFSSAMVYTLIRSPVLGQKVDTTIIENFIFELMAVTKASILGLKKIHSSTSEVLKKAQVVLDAAIKLCRSYFQAIDNIERSVHINEVDYASHVVSMTSCTIGCLYELGIFAASGGGNLVAVLNVSWKGVVCLLQLGKGILAEKVDVGDIILTLLSLATDSLRCAAEAWSSTSKETLAVPEAKRTFLPIKFYLINAVRISSGYPCKAMKIYREIIRCTLLISSLGISLSKEPHLRAASEALAEFLEPTSFLLLQTLLNLADVRSDSKFQILDWLLTYEIDCSSEDLEKDFDTSEKSTLDGIFTVNCDAMPRTEAIILGRVMLFLHLLRTSTLREQAVLEISKKLDYLLKFVMHEDVYSSVLGLQIPVICDFGSSHGVSWQTFFSCIVHSLKTFMVVAASSKLVLMEVESFLLQNLIHPHFLCLEIVRELLSFFIRHATVDAVNGIFERICLIFRIIASSEPVLTPLSSLRKMARSICVLTYALPSFGDQVYTFVTGGDKSNLASVMWIALLMEGFPLDALSDNWKMVASQKIATAFYGCIESNWSELGLTDSSGSCSDRLIMSPLFALSSALLSCQIKSSEVINDKQFSQILKFTVSIIHCLKNVRDGVNNHYEKLLAITLGIISTAKHLHSSNGMRELILELHTLFLESHIDSNAVFCECKPSLASFMASLSHMEIEDGEGDVLLTAIWGLYHALLRERHWAFVHLAIASFGYFAANTSCTKLWGFVPEDAALSFDTHMGKEANEERFMAELKAFLEKEVALHAVTSCKEQLRHLFKEGVVLKKLGKAPTAIPDVSVAETMETNDEKFVKNKKRKLPDGVCEGMELLRSGVSAMNNALAQADFEELRDAFSPHISCLEDVISHLVGLSDSMLNR